MKTILTITACMMLLSCGEAPEPRHDMPDGFRLLERDPDTGRIDSAMVGVPGAAVRHAPCYIYTASKGCIHGYSFELCNSVPGELAECVEVVEALCEARRD